MSAWTGVDSPWSGSEEHNSYGMAICWSPELAIFVAVGVGYPSPGPVLTSPDGVTWTGRAAADATELCAVCWSPDLSLFIAIDKSGTGDDYAIYTSPDGVTWTGVAAPDGIGSGTGVCWSSDASLFVATLTDPTSPFHDYDTIVTSPDGVTWTLQTVPSAAWAGVFRGVCWSPALSLFVVAGANATNTSAIMTSPDGVTWTVATTPFDTYGAQSVGWAPTPAVLIAGCATSGSETTALMTSPDGATWTTVSSPFDGDLANNVATAFTDTGVNAVAASGNVTGSGAAPTYVLAESPDGSTWTADTLIDMPAPVSVFGLAYAPTLGLAVAVGSGEGAVRITYVIPPGAYPFFHHSYPSS